MSDPAVYGLILAGGSGTRFWPLSRDDRPKQLLRLFDDETLLEKAARRLEALIPRENLIVLTNAAQEASVRAILPDLPAVNVISEPERRDTAPALALGIAAVARRSPEAVMVVIPADQLIRDEAGFVRIIEAAVEAARASDALVTLGIKPTWGCPSYGYIERGPRASISGYRHEIPVHEVLRFREKPDADLAEQYFESGAYSWNAGIFIWTVPAVIRELTRHCPELADFVSELRHSRDFAATLAKQFPALTRISIDYALMEKAARVLNIEADIGWDDVGGWISIGKYLEQATGDNAVRGPVTLLDCYNNVVFGASGRRVALLGVHDLIVVETADAILIADKDEADRVKKLVDQMPPDLR
ncbi:MAG: mannose-1-phosphate guanylyltransferase [Verrucomicrobiales bacterium]|nr:mannose-1-phosphate guanylyltransferase [Verrucomicrobiales bacterium]